MANINKNEIGYNENTTANALMVQYKRGLAAPMDISEVFTSLTSAQQYAKGDPIAYAGQTIAVAGEGIKTEVYKITSGGTLVRLVDENDIKNLSGGTNNITVVNPDWNAQQGEAGYIKNKPFGFNITETYNYKKDEDENLDGRIDIEMFSFTVDYNEEGGGYNFPDIEMTGNVDGMERYYLGSLYNLPTYTGYYDDSDRWISAESQVDYSYEGLWLEYSDGSKSYYRLYLRTWVGRINYDINVNVGHITLMSENYLPNTVLKTTPQSLSDDAKNQVKENLGISNPDWLASEAEGEPGHIKNRTHGLDWPLCVLNKDNTSAYIGSFSEVYVAFNGGVEMLEYGKSLSMGINLIRLEYNDYTVSLVEDEPGLINDFVNSDIRIFGVVSKLNDIYLPNTVLKTTPNGDVYITGIGGFDGVNYDNAKSVQDTIKELTETVKNLNDIIKQITITE